MPKSKEGPAAWIAAAAAVVIIPVTIVLAMSTKDESPPVSAATGRDEGIAAPTLAASGSVAASDECVHEDGGQANCASPEAWLVVPASPCTTESASRALGADPDEIELQIQARDVGNHCAVAPTVAARAGGTTISDLIGIGEGRLPARVLTCWQAADPRTAVACNQPHHFEPVGHWKPLQDQALPQSVCPETVRRYVAGSVDSANGALSTNWVITEEEEPRFRCLVKSRHSLIGTVHRLSGRPLPTATST